MLTRMIERVRGHLIDDARRTTVHATETAPAPASSR